MLVLLFKPGGANAEDGATAGDVVESGGELGGERRLAEGVRANHQADAHVLRGFGPCDEGGPAFKDWPVRVADDWIDVIPSPEVVVADAICRDGHRAHGCPIGELWPDECADFDLLVHDEPPALLLPIQRC